MICPICNKKLIGYTSFGNRCYRCDSSIYSITFLRGTIKATESGFSHYDLVKYEKSLLATKSKEKFSLNYIIDRFYVRCTNNSSDIYFVKEGRQYNPNSDIFIIAEFLCTVNSQLFLTKDNSEKIKNKLKCYLTFS